MDDPVVVPLRAVNPIRVDRSLGDIVSASTLASKLAPSGPLERPAPMIQYTPEVLESIRMLCLASFVADGAGVPILGLLYGTRSEGEIRITAWVPAGELRSHNDAEFALKLQMRMAPQRPETAGLECLGWVRTRNHGEPRLVEEDRTLFDRCFPASWETVMVVRPSYQKPTKAAFYQRGVGNALRFDRPAQEFFLYPAHEGERDAPLLPTTDKGPERALRPVPVSEPKGAEPSTLAAKAAAHANAHAAESRHPDLHPELLPPGTVKAFSPWIAAMLVLVGLLAGSGVAALRGRPDAPVVATAAGEPLRIQQENGAWQVRWDRSLAELPGASGASLAVTRDGQTKTIALPLDQFRLGAASLDRIADDMEVALRVDRPGYPETEQRVRVVGVAGKPKAPARSPRTVTGAGSQPRTNL